MTATAESVDKLSIIRKAIKKSEKKIIQALERDKQAEAISEILRLRVLRVDEMVELSALSLIRSNRFYNKLVLDVTRGIESEREVRCREHSNHGTSRISINSFPIPLRQPISMTFFQITKEKLREFVQPEGVLNDSVVLLSRKSSQVPEAKKGSKKRKLREQRDNVNQQRIILDEKADALKISAKEVSRRVNRGDKHRATEAMMSVALDLQNAEPVLTNYVNNLLLLRVYEIMHLEGYVDPTTLPEAMADIDYGLYSLSTEDELRDLLSQATDPLAIIGIDLK